MRNGLPLLALMSCTLLMPQDLRAQQPAAPRSSLSAAPQSLAPMDPRALLTALNLLRVDPTRVYQVSGLNLRRDAIHLSFAEGKLAFFQSLGGRITGAVFSGTGHVIAIPRAPGERRSLARYLGVPILDLSFSSAYLRFDDASAAELQDQLRQDGAKPATDADFATNWNPILANLNPSQSLRIMMDLLSTAPMPFFYAGLLNDSVGPFELLFDGRRAEQVLMGQNRMANGAYYYDVWASFPAQESSPPPAPNAQPPAADAASILEPFVPLDYRVDTTIAPDLSLEGSTILHLKAARAGERVMSLELSRDLAVESVAMEGGAPLVFFQNDELSRREALQRGNDALLVVLPSPSTAGEDLRLRVTYSGSIIFDAGNGVRYVGERGTWYAHIAGDDFVRFDLAFRWPKRYTLVATGTRTASAEQGDFETGRWRSDAPFAVAGFNLGEYKVQDAGNGEPAIHLYANSQIEEAILARLQPQPAEAIAPRFPRRRQAARASLDFTPVAAPSPADVLRQLGDQVAGSIRFFEQMNGPFPFDHLDISQIPSSMGQSWPELVYLSTLAFLPSRTEDQAGITDAAQRQSRELMPFHEVAHQWWGNLVDAASYRDVWIEEGMAHYLALLYDDSRKPSEHRMDYWLDRYRDVLLTKASGSDGTVGEAGPLVMGYRLDSSKTPNAYPAIIYGKGAWVMHMLHEMMRDPASSDPDARFRDLLRSVLAQYRFRTLSTDDFERAVSQRMTPEMDLDGSHSMDWFFDEWVRDTGIPHYRVEYQVRPRGAEFVVTGTLAQSGVGSLFTARVPLYASLAGGKLAPLGNVVAGGPETSFRFVTRVRPSRVVIDPHRTLLCRAN